MTIGTISAVDLHDEGGAAITYDGWTLFITEDELIKYIEVRQSSPQIGQTMETGPGIGYPIQYIRINNILVRNVSDEEQAAKHKAFCDKIRRDKEEDFAAHGDEWKARVQTLLPVLRARMERFEREEGDEFWIDSGAYELYAIGAADVLARKAIELHPEDYSAQIEWIDWWDSINSKTYDYDYKRQMEILPEFGDGHSGNTHSAAVYFAKRAIREQEC
jgi:hypothetical protein